MLHGPRDTWWLHHALEDNLTQRHGGGRAGGRWKGHPEDVRHVGGGSVVGHDDSAGLPHQHHPPVPRHRHAPRGPLAGRPRIPFCARPAPRPLRVPDRGCDASRLLAAKCRLAFRLAFSPFPAECEPWDANTSSHR